MGKRLNAKIRKQTLELLNQLKQSNKLSNRSYEAFRNNIETSRIDVVKRLKQNFDVIKTTDKTFTKGSLKENVETIKQTKREKIAKLIPSIKKRFNDISLVNDFNKNRKETTIKNITGVKLQRILKNVDATKGVSLRAGNKYYTLTPEKIKDLISNVDSFFVKATTSNESDEAIIQEIINLKQVSLIPFEKKKDKNQGGFFKHYNTTTINLEEFQIYNSKQIIYNENCFVYALIQSNALTNEEINTIKFMCAGIFVPCNKISEVCDKFNLTIRVKIVIDRDITHADIKKYGKGSRVITIGLIEKHYFAIKEIPFTLYSIKHYFELKDIPDFNKIKSANGKKATDRNTDSFQAIKYMYENNYFTPMPYADMLDTQYADPTNEITSLEYDETDTQPNKIYTKKIDGNYITSYNFGKEVKEKFELVFFDFETITEGEYHIPYLVCDSFSNKTHYGEDCGKQLLYSLCNKLVKCGVKTIILVAHNAGYDYRFIMKYLMMDSEITSGKKLLEAKGKFYYKKGEYIKIIIKDSYSIAGLGLDKWGKAMKVNSVKQIIPYDIYTNDNVKLVHIDVGVCKTFCAIECKKKKYCEGVVATEEDILKFYNTFMENAKSWNCINDNESIMS